MNQSPEPDNLAGRREFLRRAIVGAGVALSAPAILSVVRPSDLSAQASGGGFRPAGGPNGGSGGPPRRPGPPSLPPGLNRR